MRFTYGELVIDCRTHTNRIIELSTFKVPQNCVDCFRSVFLHSYDLELYAQQTGSVQGYTGKVTLDWLPIVFSSRDTTLALDETRKFIDHLNAVYDIEPTHLRICFSGSTGFHIHIPAELFGSVEPSESLPRIVKAMVFGLTDGFKTVDCSIYDPIGLIRLSNTVDSVSGLFKVPVSYDELMQLSFEEIKVLARTTRTLGDLVPKSDIMPNDGLLKLYEIYRDHVRSKAK